MRSIKILITAFSITVLLSAAGYSAEFLDLMMPAEAIGTGNTFTACSSEANSIWGNPAGLGKTYINYYAFYNKLSPIVLHSIDIQTHLSFLVQLSFESCLFLVQFPVLPKF